MCRPHLCHGQRLEGYEFCIKHILEDKSAPYRPCAYTAESQGGVRLNSLINILLTLSPSDTNLSPSSAQE